MDQIFFVHQPIHMIGEWNAKKRLGELTKVFNGFRKTIRAVTNTFSRKLHKTTKELDLPKMAKRGSLWGKRRSKTFPVILPTIAMC